MKRITIKCPNCQEKVTVRLNANRYGKSLVADCWTCGWRKVAGGKELDFIQPDHPFFEVIYGHNPIEKEKARKKRKEIEKEKNKAELDKKYYEMYKSDSSGHSRRKPWEEKFIRKKVLEEN